MNLEDLHNYCSSKKGVTESFPFDSETLVFKVMGKMFCLIGLDRWENGDESINVKCDPEVALRLREEYENTVIGAFHMSKKHWNTVYVNRELSPTEILTWIDHSYDLVTAGLARKDKDLLKNL